MTLFSNSFEDGVLLVIVFCYLTPFSVNQVSSSTEYEVDPPLNDYVILYKGEAVFCLSISWGNLHPIVSIETE